MFIQLHVCSCNIVDLLDIVMLVFLSDLYVLPIRHQIMSLQLSQSLIVHSKEHLQTTLLDIVLPKGVRYNSHEKWKQFAMLKSYL